MTPTEPQKTPMVFEFFVNLPSVGRRPTLVQGLVGIGFLPGEKTLVVGREQPCAVEIWDCDRRHKLRTLFDSGFSIMGTGALQDLSLSPDGDQVAVALGSRRPPLILDAQTGDVVVQVRGVRSATRIGWHPNGRMLFSAYGDSASALEVATGKQEWTKSWDQQHFVTCLALNRDGSRLAVGHVSGRASLLDASRGDTLKAWTATHGFHNGSVNCLAFDVSSSTIVCGNESGSLSVWNSQSGAKLTSFSEQSQKSVTAIAIDQHSSRICYGVVNGLVKLWDLQHMVELEVLAGHRPKSQVSHSVRTGIISRLETSQVIFESAMWESGRTK